MSIDKMNPMSAASAYANAQKNIVSGGDEGGEGEGSGSAGGAGSFGSMLQQVTKDAIGSLKGSEKVSAQAVTGKADLADVVSATTSADMTLQEVVAVRDKMVNAYQEIERMAI